MIVRAKRKTANFTVLPNEAIRDVRLSFKARGLLAFILSMPDHWATSSTALARMGPDGRDSVRAGLRELRDLGYVQLHKRQQPGGRWVTDVMVFETPQEPVDNAGDNSSPRPEKPTPENPALIQELTSKGFNNSDNSRYRARVICGNCNGTTWAVAPDSSVSRCPCKGGVILNGN